MALLLTMAVVLVCGLGLIVLARGDSARRVGLALVAAVPGYLAGSALTFRLAGDAALRTLAGARLDQWLGCAAALLVAAAVISLRPFSRRTEEAEIAQVTAQIARRHAEETPDTDPRTEEDTDPRSEE